MTYIIYLLYRLVNTFINLMQVYKVLTLSVLSLHYWRKERHTRLLMCYSLFDTMHFKCSSFSIMSISYYSTVPEVICLIMVIRFCYILYRCDWRKEISSRDTSRRLLIFGRISDWRALHVGFELYLYELSDCILKCFALVRRALHRMHHANQKWEISLRSIWSLGL